VTTFCLVPNVGKWVDHLRSWEISHTSHVILIIVTRNCWWVGACVGIAKHTVGLLIYDISVDVIIIDFCYLHVIFINVVFATFLGLFMMLIHCIIRPLTRLMTDSGSQARVMLVNNNKTVQWHMCYCNDIHGTVAITTITVFVLALINLNSQIICLCSDKWKRTLWYFGSKSDYIMW
jgi:hypothetical protein